MSFPERTFKWVTLMRSRDDRGEGGARPRGRPGEGGKEKFVERITECRPLKQCRVLPECFLYSGVPFLAITNISSGTLQNYYLLVAASLQVGHDIDIAFAGV
jgi:hypothetical protein